jgi:predicted DNA-binding transcriptional regulator AlpA
MQMTTPTLPSLPIFVRYADLVSSNIVRSWTQLLRMIDHENFPVGQMLSPNIRVWRLDEIEAWLAGRPTARKVPPPTSKPRGRERAAEAEPEGA